MKTTGDDPIHESFPSSATGAKCCIAWKLYENPFYQKLKRKCGCWGMFCCACCLNHRMISSSSRRFADFPWDLSIAPIRAAPIVVGDEFHSHRVRIKELEAEMAQVRKARKKLETKCRRLTKEMVLERKGRAELVRVCETLTRVVSSQREELVKIQKELQETKKFRIDVGREDQVKFILSDAKLMVEQKMIKSQRFIKQGEVIRPLRNITRKTKSKSKELVTARSLNGVPSQNFSCVVLEEKSCDRNDGRQVQIRRKLLTESENPLISRGMKSLVELPRITG